MRKPRPLFVDTLANDHVKRQLGYLQSMFDLAGVGPTLTALEYCRLYHTGIARRVYGIRDNAQVYAVPPRELWPNIIAFAHHCWLPLRDRVGVPLFLKNGYRPPRYNKAAKGAHMSKHQWAGGGDIYPVKGSDLSGRDLRDAAIDLVLDRREETEGTSIYGLGLYAGNVHLDWGLRNRFKKWGSRLKEFNVEKAERDAQPDTDDYEKGGVAA